MKVTCQSHLNEQIPLRTGKMVSIINDIGYFPVEPDGSDVKIGVLQVNCFDWEDVCGKENIRIYPTVRFYRYIFILCVPMQIDILRSVRSRYMSPG